jgi:hypothetical protein
MESRDSNELALNAEIKPGSGSGLPEQAVHGLSLGPEFLQGALSMTVLTKEILDDHGPYIRLADCTQSFDMGEYHYPRCSAFERDIFFEISDCLIGSYCSITRSTAPFDSYGFEQLDEPHKIRKLSAELVIWAHQLLRTQPHVFARHIEHYAYYDDCRLEDRGKAGEQFRLDLIETLLFLTGRLSRIAQANHCLVIDGI